MKAILKTITRSEWCNINPYIASLIQHKILIEGKIYDVESTPTIYDPDTFEISLNSFSFIVKCDDGLSRKLPKLMFITLEDIREEKLNSLLEK